MAEQFAPPPINPVISIRPVTTAPPGQDATNVQTPLAALPPGTILEGFVVNRDAGNQPILRTAIGDLQMQSEVFVKTGSEMVIRVDTTSESRARIVTIDGMEPEIYAAQQTRGMTQDTIVPSQLLSRAPGAAPGTAPMPTQPALQGMLLSAAPVAGNATPHPLLAALPPGIAIPAGLLKLQAGASLKVNILQIDLPTMIGPGATASKPIAGNPTQPQTAPGASQAPLTPQPSANQQQPMQQLSMASTQAARIAQQPSPFMPPQATATNLPAPRGNTLPSRTTAQPVTPLPSNALPGIVIGHEADGGNIVQTHFGTLKIFTSAPLPIQSKLTVEVEPQTRLVQPQNIQPSSVPPAEEADGLSSLSREWAHLSEATRALGMQDPQAARDLMGAMPQVGSKLASGLLFFIAAVKGGDLKQWLGSKATAALEGKLPELAAKLKGDMGQLQQLFLHSPIEQWTGVMIPMLHQGQLEYARMYLRDEPQQENKTKAQGRDQRFIVEIEMSHLGEMQFDGFVRQGQAKKQFDLMIRTAKPLPNEISGEIRTRFDAAMGATGYNGYIAFQQGAQHFVRPLAGAQANALPPHDHTILA